MQIHNEQGMFLKAGKRNEMRILGRRICPLEVVEEELPGDQPAREIRKTHKIQIQDDKKF